MTLLETMKQALEALNEAIELAYVVAHQETEVGVRAECNGPFLKTAITNLTAAIKQLEALEPVAEKYPDASGLINWIGDIPVNGTPLYDLRGILK